MAKQFSKLKGAIVDSYVSVGLRLIEAFPRIAQMQLRAIARILALALAISFTAVGAQSVYDRETDSLALVSLYNSTGGGKLDQQHKLAYAFHTGFLVRHYTA